MKYSEMKSKHRDEFDALPIYFAFNDKQFEEAMTKMGLTVDDTDKVARIPAGGFCLKTNVKMVLDTFLRHEQEHAAALIDPEYVYEMFFYELNNHEYGYTWDESDTIRALGLTADEVEQSAILKAGLVKAKQNIHSAA